MFSEAVDIISGLFDGEETFNYRGRYFDVESAKLWDLPEERVPIGIAVSGQDSCRLAGQKADIMIATEPRPELWAGGSTPTSPVPRPSRRRPSS